MPKSPNLSQGPYARAWVICLILTLAMPCLASMPGQMESHLRTEDTSGSFALRLGILAHRDPAVFENAQAQYSGQSQSIDALYFQSHRFDLLYSPWERQVLSLEIPFAYTYLILPRLGYGSLWQWKGASLAWRSRLSFEESIHLTLFAGGWIPGQDSRTWDWVKEDLSSLSRAALTDSLPQRDAKSRIGLLLGWQGDFRLPFLIRATWLKMQMDLRRPILVSSVSPATLVDYAIALEIPVFATMQLLLSSGQTRVWKTHALWRTSTPQATHLQASLGFTSQFGGAFALGTRYNPRWAKEYQPYVLPGPENTQVVSQVTAEPQAQLFLELGYNLGKVQKQTNTKPLQPRSTHHRIRGEMDNDRDSIPDTRDACPNIAEDRDGFRDLDGCPDADNDNDSIVDVLDMCPNDAEDRDNFEDGDGCPDLDNDRDGRPDAQDQCPTAKEIVNFYHDEDGCPDEKPEHVGSRDLESLGFASGQKDWDTTYHDLIRKLTEKMLIYPGTELLIVGHADFQEQHPQDLSLQRAKSVAEALYKGGVEKYRIRIEGRGTNQPAANHRTASGRQKNRRITLEPR